MELPFAQRTDELTPFLVMEVMERAQELERAGRSIVHLEVGEPDFDTPAVVTAAGQQALAEGQTHYTHSLGLQELREVIAERYASRYGAAVSPEQVLITPGSSLGLLYLFGALLEPGDEVVAGTPHYPCYPNFVRFFGGRFVEVPADPGDGYRLDPARVRQAITPRTRALLLNSPSNPTGAVLEADRLRALAALGVPIVCDEIYHGLTYEGRPASMLEFAADACVVDGFSKRYAMTGWRLGWLVAPASRMRRLQTMQQNFMISPSAFAQRAGIAAIDNEDALVEPMREVYDRRRRLMVTLLREVGFGIPCMPAGAFYVFADASQFTDDAYAFAFELLGRAGVGVAPGVDFGEAGRRSLRFSYASSEDCIREGARRLREYLSAR